MLDLESQELCFCCFRGFPPFMRGSRLPKLNTQSSKSFHSLFNIPGQRFKCVVQKRFLKRGTTELVRVKVNYAKGHMG